MDLQSQRNDRLAVLKNIEDFVGCPVIVYFTRAPAWTAGSDPNRDATIPMLEHLRALGKQKRIALYPQGLGGVTEASWLIVTMLREFCDELDVIVTEVLAVMAASMRLVSIQADSAATLMAIGADKIYMSRAAKLGPIHPAFELPYLTRDGVCPLPPDLFCEDLGAFTMFLHERGKVTEHTTRASLIARLEERLTPPYRGRLERACSHIRLLERNLLSLHRPSLDDRQISAITDVLTENIYLLGHGIGREEAKELGLVVHGLNDHEEEEVWALYRLYESMFPLRKDVEGDFREGSDIFERRDFAVACIESSMHLHGLIGTVRAQKTPVPPNPTINVNMNLPGNIELQHRRQPPVVMGFLGGRWLELV